MRVYNYILHVKHDLSSAVRKASVTATREASAILAMTDISYNIAAICGYYQATIELDEENIIIPHLYPYPPMIILFIYT